MLLAFRRERFVVCQQQGKGDLDFGAVTVGARHIAPDAMRSVVREGFEFMFALV
jgi:hypothetical protein